MNKNLSQSNSALQSIKNANQNEIILYRPNDTISLEVRLENETVWLSIDMMSELFQRDKSTISRHIKNIFAEGELMPISVVANFATTASDGKIYRVDFYNLDVVISVGYRVKSIRGTQFRQWANKVLKEYLLSGYSINSRVLELEKQVAAHSEKIEFMLKANLPPKEKLFFDGQLFDAHILMSQLVESAEKRIVLIDNYVDESVLTLLLKRKKHVTATIYTMQMSGAFKLDLQKHNAQYSPVSVNLYTKAHGRFLIIDDKVYHVGASVKDLGKKLCAVSLLSCIDADEMINKL
ncbi:MAG: RhuM family protein [Paludibacteraceae bacterium]|nr:RhuM family protein [Paludibacteraceae bacterium]